MYIHPRFSYSWTRRRHSLLSGETSETTWKPSAWNQNCLYDELLLVSRFWSNDARVALWWTSLFMLCWWPWRDSHTMMVTKNKLSREKNTTARLVRSLSRQPANSQFNMQYSTSQKRSIHSGKWESNGKPLLFKDVVQRSLVAPINFLFVCKLRCLVEA